jgi:PhnB protein
MSVTSYLCAANAKAAIEFYKRAFGAKELLCFDDPDGKRIGHCELEIAGGKIMLTDEYPDMIDKRVKAPKKLGGTCVTVHMELNKPADVDRMVANALAAGAVIEAAPEDRATELRRAALFDPFGHRWLITAPL